jgi:3-isopropylmalate/(R)-2-methylmalate dehydratase small subunit
MMNWTMTGRCWKFGDDVPNDGGLMDKTFLTQKLDYDPKNLAPHVFKRLRPEFAANAKPGDIVVAGRKFANGAPHIQGVLGLRALGVGVVVEHLQRSSFRLMISAGVPLLPSAPAIRELVDDGDEVRVDFHTGKVENLTRGVTAQFEPLPEFLLEVIAAGGSRGHLKQRLIAAGKIPADAAASVPG